jgi:hypothetical protein
MALVQQALVWAAEVPQESLPLLCQEDTCKDWLNHRDLPLTYLDEVMAFAKARALTLAGREASPTSEDIVGHTEIGSGPMGEVEAEIDNSALPRAANGKRQELVLEKPTLSDSALAAYCMVSNLLKSEACCTTHSCCTL